MARGTNPNSLKNLEKGRTKGKGRDKPGNYSDNANTFKALYEAIGSLDLTNEAWAKLKGIGIDKAWCKARGITQYRKLLKAVSNYLDDSPQMNKEVLERLEGKVKEQVELSGEIAVKGYCQVSPDDWDSTDSTTATD